MLKKIQLKSNANKVSELLRCGSQTSEISLAEDR